MGIRPYEKGIVKVVWVGQALTKINSKMFDTVDDARRFAKKKHDYLIFHLISQKNMKDFSWELLPFGSYRFYLNILKNYQRYKEGMLKFFGIKGL